MPKILIADDEWLTRLEIEEMLTGLGYDVAGQAETGAEAVAMARELNPDLILMDVEMPGEINGIDAARVIKAELGTPIVFVSGYGDPEHIEAAKEIVPFGYVMKPFDEREIHAFVEIALSRKELELKLEEAHDELERRVESRTAELAKANKQLKEENEARKRTEEALRENEGHLRSLMESATNFAVYRLISDSDNPNLLRVIFVSPSITDTMGVSKPTRFETWFEHIHPDDVERIVEANIEAFKTLRFDETMRIYHPQKQKWIWIHSISTGFEDQERQCYYVNGILIDVTREKQAEKALQESEEKFRLIAENSIDAIWQTDLNNKVTYISPSSINIGGYTPEEVMRFENALELYDDELRTLIMTEMSKLLQRPVEELKGYVIPRIEGRGLHKDGHKIWVEIQAKFIFEGNMIVGVQGISRDISERKESEEALRESEKKLNAILDATTETIVLFDRNGIVHVANQIVCERLATTKEEFIGKKLYDFFPPDVAEGRRKKWNEVFNTGKPVSFEDSRKSMTFEQRAYPVLDEEGQVQMVVAFANDKTDRRLAEEALRESEEKYKKLFDTSPEAVALVDEEGRFLTANPSMAKRFEQEIEGKTWHELMPKELADSRLEKARQAIKNKETVFFEDARAGRFMENYYVPVPISGEKRTFQVIARDVTERKQAEEALRESEKKYRRLVENALVGVYQVEKSGKFIMANERMAEIFGYDSAESLISSVGSVANLYARPEERPVVLADIEVKGAVYGRNVEFRKKNGEIVWIKLHTRVVRENEKTIYEGLMEDLTESKRAEEERIKLEEKLARSRKMETIGTLAGGVAHDLNNILGGLVSYPELLLLQLPEDSPLRKSILTIQKSGEKAAAVVQDLLALARRGVVVTEVVNLNDVIVDCRDLIPKNYHDFCLNGTSWNPAVINHRVPCRQQSTALSYPLASESPLVCLRFTQISLSDRN